MLDHFADFERAEHYRKLYLSRGMLIVVFSIIFFCLGFLVAKFIYKDSKELKIEWKLQK